MNSKSYYFSHFLFLLMLAISATFSLASKANDQNTQKSKTHQQQLIEQLAISQGKGSFNQQQYFKFLSQPINSKGSFIVNQQSVLWQTESPVFSQLLVTKSSIYKRLSLEETYQPLIANSELSTVLSALFGGQIKSQNWKILDRENQQQNCIHLEPKNELLNKVFKYATLCLLENNQRQIKLVDSDDNKTEILTTLIDTELNSEDFNSLNNEHQ